MIIDMSDYKRVPRKPKFKRGWNVCVLRHLYKSSSGSLVVWDYPVLAEFVEELCDLDRKEKRSIFPCSLKCLTNKQYIYMENARTSRQGLSHSINTSARRSGYATIKGRGE